MKKSWPWFRLRNWFNNVSVRLEQPGYEPKKRDALHREAKHESGIQNRQGRKNNANDAPQDQASAERRLAMMKRIKNRRK